MRDFTPGERQIILTLGATEQGSGQLFKMEMVAVQSLVDRGVLKYVSAIDRDTDTHRFDKGPRWEFALLVLRTLGTYGR